MSHIAVVEGSVRRVRQLTGEWERSPAGRVPCQNRTWTTAGIVGTDLGASFFDGERVWFLFGDTWPDPDLGDAFAWTTDGSPDDGLTLTFVGRDGRWTPPRVSGRPKPFSTREFEVPTGGFAVGGRRYVFYTSDHYRTTIGGIAADVMGSSALCRQAAPGTLELTDLEWVFELSNERAGGRFINAAPVVVQDPPPGLNFAGPALFVWGSGTYRHSHCYLAAVSADAPAGTRWPIEDPDRWRYLAAVGRDGSPRWSGAQGDAMPLFLPPDGGDGGIGELSVAWLAPLGVWLLTYGGATFRTAPRPWGPWSDPRPLDDAGRPAIGYGDLMHVSWDAGGLDGTDLLYDRGRGMDGGGPYGPYLIDRFTRSAGPGRAQVWFTLSTWNPYQAQLMTAVLERRRGDVEIDPGHPTLPNLRLHDGIDFGATGGGPLRRPLPSGGLSMVMSRFGPAGNNFELIAPSAGGGLLFVAARNDPWPPAWGRTAVVGLGRPGPVDYAACSMALAVTPYVGNPDNPDRDRRDRLMVAAVTGDRVVCLVRGPKEPWSWSGPYPVIAVEDDDSRHPFPRVRGNPALVASTFGAQRSNFELVVPDAEAGLRHFWFDNDPEFPLSGDWRAAPAFGAELGRVDAVAMTQSVFGIADDADRGNLEVVVRRGGELHLFWRTGDLVWHGPFLLIAEGGRVTSAAGVPALVQSRYGPAGNDFQLVTPLQGGGLAVYRRDNSAADPAQWSWHGPAVIDPGTMYAGAALVSGPFGPAPGNLELVATAGNGTVRHFYRDATSPAWHDVGTIPI